MYISNLQYIEYIISAEDTINRFCNLTLDEKDSDFELSLEFHSSSLNYRDLNINETAISYATKSSTSIFIASTTDESLFQSTVHFSESNGFLVPSGGRRCNTFPTCRLAARLCRARALPTCRPWGT